LELARPLPDASAVSSFARCRRRHELLRRIGLASMLELAAGLPSRQSKAGRRANKERSFVSDLGNALTLEEGQFRCFSAGSSLVWPRLQSGVWLSHLPRPHSIIQRARCTSSCRSRRAVPTTLSRVCSASTCRNTSVSNLLSRTALAPAAISAWKWCCPRRPAGTPSAFAPPKNPPTHSPPSLCPSLFCALTAP